MLTMDSAGVSDAFDALCRKVAERKRGLTLPELSAAHAAARELHAAEPDGKRLAELAADLGLEVAEVEAVGPTDRKKEPTNA